MRQIVSFFKESSEAATALSAALTGLQSILEGQGKSFSAAQSFIEEYTQDGLIPATNAINAYKNLALRGYDDSQIQQVMNALKDASAYGRQASYTMGEAVESATEGLKNENSILVDNAGVTKNVAKMWEEYAESIGTTANNLTQQQKIQAEVTGILEETKYQTGDAAKVAGTLSGQIQQLSYRFNDLKVAVGNASNPFAEKFLPVVNTAITALTKLANTVASVVGALFGSASLTSSVANTNESIASSASAGAAAEEELAEATEAAGKAAKKSLAGFDELNRLQGDTDSSSSSASSTSGIGATSSTVTVEAEVEDALSPKLQAIIDKVRELIEPLKQIDFTPAVEAFGRLKEAVKPLTKKLFEGLEWAWYNILVPLAEWTIEEALPAFLDLVSASLGVLNAVIVVFQPLAAWLWSNFLQPIAEWTGGAIVEVLGWIKDGLTAISDWISRNHGLVQAMTVTAGAFIAVWKVTDLITWIDAAGGIPGVLKLITNALIGNTVAKIANKAEDIAIIALYIGDYIKALAGMITKLAANTAAWIANTAAKVASTAAEWAQIAATTAWNGICAIATTVTTAFGAAVAFLTSPIGLVVIAITALIAVVALLVKNWDTVKEVAANAWNGIKNVWQTVSSWFKTTITDPVSGFFTNMWNGLKQGALNAWNGIKSVFSTVATFFKTTFSNAWKGVVSVFSTAGTIFTNIKDGILTAFKKIVNGLIDGLNNVIATPFNGINTALKTIKDIKILGLTPFSGLKTISVPKIPYLAQGAVIPPNREFLAVLGDQKHGTNVEAPLETIQEAVAMVMEGMTNGMIKGLEALLEEQTRTRQAVESIEIGDDVIGQAVARYNSKMAVVRGG